ncbi:MAG: hypothetical protein H6581_03510 [Bacteroidia bacterium]|nr:hypothetical protein [Bacteroidia bacterium]
MDIQAAKIELAKLILSLESPGLIQKIKDLVTSESSAFNESLTEHEKLEIELGLKQLNNGQRIAFDDFLERVS